MNRLNKIEFDDFLGSGTFYFFLKMGFIMFFCCLEEGPHFPKTDIHTEYLKQFK